MNSRKIFNENLLKNKKILITGASSGIGLKTAIEISELGANLILVSRSKDKFINIKRNFYDISKVKFIEADLEEPNSGEYILKQLPSAWLPLDGIFHSAGSFLLKPYALSNQDDFNKLSSVSLNTLLSFSKLMHKKKFFNEFSSILIMSSVSSNFGTKGLGYYSAIKAAINSSCRTMAIEFAKRNIRVNAIVGGAIETKMHEMIISKLSKEALEEYKSKHPLGFGKTDDISKMICFLLSDASKWITGTEICIDGGFSALK